VLAEAIKKGVKKMKVLNELLYAKSHEWVRTEGNTAYIGISSYAKDQLGEVVFIDLTELDTEVKAGDEFAEVESVKAVSEIFSPVSGTITKVNEELLDSPEKINEDVYEAWFIAVEMSDKEELNNLLSPQDYEKFCGGL
jgi:glycine cleavage system H protein